MDPAPTACDRFNLIAVTADYTSGMAVSIAVVGDQDITCTGGVAASADPCASGLSRLHTGCRRTRPRCVRRTLPLTLQGCLMRRRSAADVWSIRQCLYARYMCCTQVRLPGIFAGNVALLTGLKLINRAYRKGTAPFLQAPSIHDEWVGLLTYFLPFSTYIP